jgi:cathepsin X
VNLSPQVIINCRAGGDCEGGEPIPVYQFAYTHGIPDDSCMQYVAKDPANFTCSPSQVCQICNPPVPAAGQQSDCRAVAQPKLWFAGSYGHVAGASFMKAEIYKNGPISCGMSSTTKFYGYTGGIFSEVILFPVINHEVSILG